MRCKCGSDVNIERGTPTSLCDVCHYKAQVEAQRETVAQWILSLGMSTGHGDTIDDLLLECGAQIKELGSVQEWINVDERMPEAGRKVLAAYRNCLGKYRRICAEYVAKHSRSADDLNDEMDMDYCEEADEYYWPDGWYECIENWGDFSHLRVSDHVTHWMPLPPAPEGR